MNPLTDHQVTFPNDTAHRVFSNEIAPDERYEWIEQVMFNDALIDFRVIVEYTGLSLAAINPPQGTRAFVYKIGTDVFIRMEMNNEPGR